MRRMIQPRRRPAVTLPPVAHRAAAQRGLVALGFIAAFIAIGIGAATTAWNSPLLPVFEACCLYPIILVVILELRPVVVALRGGRRAIRFFRRELDALPETPHPQDALPARSIDCPPGRAAKAESTDEMQV